MRAEAVHTADQHDDDGEDLLGVRVGRDIAEAHGGERREREVQRRDVARRRAQPVPAPVDEVRHLRVLRQHVQPADLRARDRVREHTPFVLERNDGFAKAFGVALVH